MKTIKNVAIVVPAFSRATSLARAIRTINAALYKSATAELIICVDGGGPEEVAQVAADAVFEHGKKTVLRHKVNLGLKNNILFCGDLVEAFDAVVVVEDDIAVSPSYFEYCINIANNYIDDQSIAGISLYGPTLNEFELSPFFPIKGNSSVYKMSLPSSWGQLWTKDQWKKFREWYQAHGHQPLGESPILHREVTAWSDKSWKKYFSKYLVETQRAFIFPYQSYSTNCADGGGTHITSDSNTFQVPLLSHLFQYQPISAPKNSNELVLYDQFYEIDSKFLSDFVGIPAEQLNIDLYASKSLQLLKNRPFTLTTSDVKTAIHRYGTGFKPIELNVMQNHPVREQAPIINLARTSDVIALGSSARRYRAIELMLVHTNHTTGGLRFLLKILANLVAKAVSR